MSSGTLRALTGLLLAAAVAAGVLWINDSPLLPATHADGVRYLSSAASLAGGGELVDPVARWSSPEETRFLAHFPPGYPLSLAGMIGTGLRPHVAALWLTAASAGATAFLLFLVTSLVAGWWAGIGAVLLFFLAPPVVLLHAAVWSEPLYLPTVVALIGAMALWPDRSGIHGALAGLGVLVRFAGAAGVVAAGLWAWHRTGDRRRRAWAVTLAVVPGLLALAVWHRVASSRREAVRSAGLYVERLGSELARLLDTVAGWVVPLPGGPGALRGALAVGVGIGIVALWAVALRGRRAGPGPRPGARSAASRRLCRAAGLFGLVYAATVLLARLFADPEIPFDARIFMPVFLAGTLVTAVALREVLGREGRTRWLGLGGVGVAVLWLGAATWTNAQGIPVMKEEGRYYTAWVWFTSDVVEWVEGPSREWPRLYSNEPWLLLFQTGRAPRLLPTREDVGDWSAFEAVYRERPGPIVVLYPLRPGDLSPEELQARLDLQPELVRNEGVVLVPVADEPPIPGAVRGAQASGGELGAPRRSGGRERQK